MPHSPRRRSAVLILAMLLMAAIIGSTISLSTIIGDSGHQSQTFNDFIKASLVADSNLERGLAVVKVGRGSQTPGSTTAKINSLGGANVLTATIPSPDTLTWSQLLPRQAVTFDITNNVAYCAVPSTKACGTVADCTTGPCAIPNGGALTDGYRAITVTANRLKFAGPPEVAGQGALDLYWVGLNNTGDVYFAGRKFIDDANLTHTSLTLTSFDLFDHAYVTDTNGGTPSTWPTPATTYAIRLRLTALDKQDGTYGNPTYDDTVINTTIDTLQQVKVKSDTYTTNGTPGAGFPSRISITSTGKVNKSQTIKSASMLWQLPASSVFNYVIFTEGGITPE